MKNLRNNIAKMFIVLSVLLAFSSCKKDTDTLCEIKAGSYTYQGKTTNILTGDYTSVDGGLVVYLSGANDYITLRFPKTGGNNLTIGTLKYSSLLPTNAGYDPTIHFNGGTVSTDEITSGEVIISKDGLRFNISFTLKTAKGPVKGNFLGTLIRT